MKLVFGVFFGLAAFSLSEAQPHSINCSTSSAIQPVATTGTKEQLFQDLSSAPSTVKRIQRLLVEGDSLRTGDALKELIVFNFNGAQPANGALGGSTKAATADSFPLSAGLDLGMTVGFLEPCGINTPHVHPRASEFLILVQGSSLRFGSILENGLVKPDQNQEIAGTLSAFEATIFLQGSIHWQFNDACEKAVFVAAFDSSDAGTSTMAQNFFSLNPGIVNATLGFPDTIDGRNIEEFRQAIPPNLAQDVSTCLARCRA